MPDFAHAGDGVRLSGVNPGSPAAGVGLREGDVILELAGRPVADLRGYAEILRSLEPGARVRIRYLRAGESREVTARTVAR